MDTNELDKKIKKLRIFDELLLAFGRHKMMIKRMNDVKHLTLNFLKGGILDVHETMEGREKRYTPLEKLDLNKLSEATIETFEKELLHILKEVDIRDPSYRNIEAVIFPKREAFEKATVVKRKEMMIRKNKLKDVMKHLIFVPMKDLQNCDFKVAYLLKEGKEFALLYRIKGRFFLIKWSDLESMFQKIFEISKQPG